LLKAIVLKASYAQIQTTENSFSLIYSENPHIREKEWIKLTHSRIKWQVYKHDNEFTASAKDENFLTS